jgi:hypothetical protein
MAAEKTLLEQLMNQLTVDVPTAGRALADLSRNAAYDVAARDGAIAGIAVFEAGGKKRVATAPIRKKLGLE